HQNIDGSLPMRLWLEIIGIDPITSHNRQWLDNGAENPQRLEVIEIRDSDKQRIFAEAGEGHHGGIVIAGAGCGANQVVITQDCARIVVRYEPHPVVFERAVEDTFFAAGTRRLQNQTCSQRPLSPDISEIGKKALPADLLTSCEVRLL